MFPSQRFPLGSMYVAGMPLLQQSLFQLQGLIKGDVPRCVLADVVAGFCCNGSVGCCMLAMINGSVGCCMLVMINGHLRSYLCANVM